MTSKQKPQKDEHAESRQLVFSQYDLDQYGKGWFWQDRYFVTQRFKSGPTAKRAARAGALRWCNPRDGPFCPICHQPGQLIGIGGGDFVLCHTDKTVWGGYALPTLPRKDLTHAENANLALVATCRKVKPEYAPHADPQPAQLVIGPIAASAADVCGVCGHGIEPHTGGLGLFTENRHNMACRNCGTKNAPELVAAIDLVRAARRLIKHLGENPAKASDDSQDIPF